MSTATRKIAFIDSRVADYQTLIDGLEEGTPSRRQRHNFRPLTS